jgi:hypothetical protein
LDSFLSHGGIGLHALHGRLDFAPGAYRILVFHFAEGSNASGFVAWLAGIMKKEAGTGAMVVCGFDARATPALWQTSLGLFDYYRAALEELTRERGDGMRLVMATIGFCSASKEVSTSMCGMEPLNNETVAVPLMA